VLPSAIVEAEFVHLSSLLKNRVFDDGEFDFDIVTFYGTVDAAEGGFAFFVFVSFGVVGLLLLEVKTAFQFANELKVQGLNIPAVSGIQKKMGNMIPRNPH
jgi:hypothetical protein